MSVDHLKSGLGARTARGGAIVLASQLGRIFIQLTTTFFLARLLAPDDFGVVALAYTVIAVLNLFTDISLNTVTVQAPKLDQNLASGMFYINIVLATVSLGVLAAVSPLLGWAFHDPRLPLVAIGLAAATPLGALGAQHYALLVRNMKWAKLQTLSLSTTAFGAIVGVLSAWLLDIGYWALVVQVVASAATSVIAVWLVCPWRPGAVTNWTAIWPALRMSLNLSGNMIMGFIHRQMDNVLIGWRWGATELGYYARSYSILMMPLNLVVGPLFSAIVPALSRLQDEPAKWRAAYLDSLVVCTAVGGGLAAILFGAPTLLIEIVLGDGWDKSETIFSSLTLALLVSTPMNTVSWIYISLGRADRMLRWGVIGATTYVAAFLIGLPYGAVGVATAYGIAQVLAFTPCMWMATRKTSVSLMDVLMAAGPIMIVTVLTGVALRMATVDSGMVLGIAAACLAAASYAAIVAAIIWFWAPHRRVRDRLMSRAASLLARLTKRKKPVEELA